MLITPHVAVGCAIGANINNPYLVAILSAGSHYVLDMLPHYDSGVRHGNPQGKVIFDIWDWIFVGADVAIALLVICWLYLATNNINIVIGGMVTFMIDFLDKIFFIKWEKGKLVLDTEKYIPIVTPLNNFHKNIHFRLNPAKWYWGVIIQLIVVVISFIILI